MGDGYEFAVSTTGYDLSGCMSFRRDGEGRTTAYAYDSLDRPVRETAPSGAVTAYTVDADGNRLSASYGGGRTQAWSYDSEGRVLTARSGNLPDTAYTYDAAGNLASFTDAANSTTSMKFTLLNKPWQQTLPGGSVRTYEYDADGNVTKETDANGKVTQHAYDALSRRTLTQLPAGDDVTAIDYAYDRNGNLVSSTEHAANTPDPDRTVAYTYDSLDRPVTKTDGDGNLSVAVYDETGNRTSLTTAGRKTHYDFDELNRVREVKHGSVTSQTSVATYTWNKASQPVAIARANGTSTVYGYDNGGRLASLGHDLGGSRIAGFEYSYASGDAMDLVSRLKEYRPAGSLETTNYTYDSAARLTQWQVAGASPYTTTLGLGSTGDRLTETTTGTGAKTRSYSYNSRHQLEGLTDSSFGGGQGGQLVYQWDNEGRLLSKGAPLSPSPKTFTWDSRDRLKAVEEAFQTLGEYRYEETGLTTESFRPVSFP